MIETTCLETNQDIQEDPLVQEELIGLNQTTSEVVSSRTRIIVQKVIGGVAALAVVASITYGLRGGGAKPVHAEDIPSIPPGIEDGYGFQYYLPQIVYDSPVEPIPEETPTPTTTATPAPTATATATSSSTPIPNLPPEPTATETTRITYPDDLGVYCDDHKGWFPYAEDEWACDSLRGGTVPPGYMLDITGIGPIYWPSSIPQGSDGIFKLDNRATATPTATPTPVPATPTPDGHPVPDPESTWGIRCNGGSWNDFHGLGKECDYPDDFVVPAGFEAHIASTLFNGTVPAGEWVRDASYARIEPARVSSALQSESEQNRNLMTMPITVKVDGKEETSIVEFTFPSVEEQIAA